MTEGSAHPDKNRHAVLGENKIIWSVTLKNRVKLKCKTPFTLGCNKETYKHQCIAIKRHFSNLFRRVLHNDSQLMWKTSIMCHWWDSGSLHKNPLTGTWKLNKWKQSSVLPFKERDEKYVATQQILEARNNSMRFKKNLSYSCINTSPWPRLLTAISFPPKSQIWGEQQLGWHPDSLSSPVGQASVQTCGSENDWTCHN